MARLTIPEIAVLGEQLFSGQRALDDVGNPYSAADFLEGLDLGLEELERRVAGEDDAQFRYRLPGTPMGDDWNHDQQHFDTGELVTHLTGSLRAWLQTLVDEGVPVAPLLSDYPPAETETGAHGSGLGAGGRGDLSRVQVLAELRKTRRHLAEVLAPLDEAQWKTMVPNEFFGRARVQDAVMFMAMHTAAHTFQLMEIQADPGYPRI